MPSACAAAGVTSMMRSRTNGPRSLIVTTTERPFAAIGDANPGSERQRAVRPRQSSGFQSCTACSVASALGGIDRSHAALGMGASSSEEDDLEGSGKQKDQLVGNAWQRSVETGGPARVQN